ncbi:hypothetical protein BH09MYX1_BH09MYX1_46370 [soil metagenome]
MSRLRAGAFAALLAVAVVLPTRQVLASADDVTISATVVQIMNDEYAQASFGPAKVKLQAALEKCKRGKCAPATKAQVYVALGMVASQTGQADEAKANFVAGLNADPSVKLPDRGTSPSIRAQFAEAQKTVVADAPAPTATAAPPPAATAPAATSADPPPPPPPAAGGSAPKGWNSAEAFQLASAGLAGDIAGKLDVCIEKDRESLKIEEQPGTRLHLASCERRSGKLLDALRDAQKALEDGIQKKDAPVMRVARDKVTDILQKIPHVTFQAPAGVTDLTVTFDDRPVPKEALSKRFSVDPGKHTVHADGVLNGVSMSFDQEYDIKEAELVTVIITLKTQASEYLTPGQLKCMLGAKSQAEVLLCLPQNKKNIVVRAGLDISAYTDTNAVNVVSPSINGSVSSPTAGWNFGASYLLDVVTAASPDVVSMASPAFRDRRHAITATGGFKPGIFGFQANGGLSVESDYTSISGGIAATMDLRDKLLTPRLAINYSHDTIGRSTTPYDIFSNNLDTTSIDAGVTIVMSSTTLFLLNGTVQLERGDQSKPYRYVPLFDPKRVAPRVPAGFTIDGVNANRLPLKPAEQLPTERDRYALGGRFIHRLNNATLRIDERLYFDTWGTKATSTDARYVQDVGKRIRVWPHLRFHAQTGAGFYQLAYSAGLNQDGSISVPLFRTTDRELSPLVTLTAGGGIRLGLTAPESPTQIGLTLQGDVMYTRFLNALYVTTRTAVYGTFGIDAEFD